MSDKEKVQASQIAIAQGIDYVKTSTGFSSGGATIEDAKLLIKTVGSKAKVKASGGIRTLEDAEAYIQLGVSRLGVSNTLKFLEK